MSTPPDPRRPTTFCDKPHLPLSSRARALCPLAKDIAVCEGFAAACADPNVDTCAPAKEKPPPSRSWPKLQRFFELLGSFARAFVWVFVGAAALLLLVAIARAVSRARRDHALADLDPKPAPGPDAAAPDVPADLADDALLRRAEWHAHRGDNAIALQLYLAASLRALDRRGALRVSKDRTNGEYVRSCTEAGAVPSLREIVRDVDCVQFGHEEATPQRVSRAARLAEAIVRASLTVLVVVFAALLGACGGADDPCTRPVRAGDDPAGMEILQALLHKQGIITQPLDRSLASLPLLRPGDPPAAVLVDSETTDLDEETEAHLVSWVEAGGILVLAGSPSTFPAALGASSGGANDVREVNVRMPADEDQDDDDETPAAPRPEDVAARGMLARNATLHFADASARTVAWFPEGAAYAETRDMGSGTVLGLASDDLLTNAGLAHPGNAAATVALLSNVPLTHLWIAQKDDGVAPPASPIAALMRAGLGLGLAHGVGFIVILFLAAGVRMARPKPASPPPRRAFAQHVEAVGGLYARAGSAAHALVAYARFADERLRARMPSGASDVPAFLAARSSTSIEECRRIWARAMSAGDASPPRGDELDLLRDLGGLYAAATSQNR